MTISSQNQWNDLSRKAEQVRLFQNRSLGDQIITDIFNNAEEIARKVIKKTADEESWTLKADNILTSKFLGYPIMLLLLALIFWITINGANEPSHLLSLLLFSFQDILTDWFMALSLPDWLHGVVVLGLYRSLAWVVSVMLPPMAIFFPLFTLLEDLGYLPRVAFNLDHLFKKANACGKQSLTMCMGFGCNAAAIVSCRIIDSPRERLIAILTNNYVPCNGRFPTLIALGTIFGAGAFSQGYQSLAIAAIITALILIGVGATFALSWLLSHTILKGEASTMVLELPPYRRPKVGSIIYRSILDRTIFVLRRAVIVAAPAGALTWALGNIYIGELSLISHAARALQPLAGAIGLDGFILMAFILGLPANEIVLPILIMSYMSTGYMLEFDSLFELRNLLVDNGWTWLTAVNTMLFSLLHWPCGTTLLTVLKETGSKKWTLLAFMIPTALAFTVCFLVAQIVYAFKLV
ncbi:MAG: nucleoside recognition domain-containing protein [Desulfitobacteriia bacterium]|jgi:ferrous iron transport protein B